MRNRAVIFSVVLCMVTGACQLDQGAWTTEDEWYRPLPPGTRVAGWELLAHDRIYEVVEARLSDAEQRLLDVSSVSLTDEEAAELMDRPLPPLPGTRPYLVRGLVLSRATGGFSVHILEDDVYVRHGSLGRRAVPMTRQPLVLLLERAPADVYVAVSMAE